jgi:hypothetical protein
MKVVRLGVLVVVFGLLAIGAAIAKPNTVYKTVATQKSGKPGVKGPVPQKNSSRSNGTEIHRKR